MSTMKAVRPERRVASEQEWHEAHKAHLAEEKKFTRHRDELSRRRRELPWVRVEKNYLFDGRNGKRTLADLFEGRSQLIIYHFMFGPEWEEGCATCSMSGDHMDSSRVHLNQRDVTLVAVSRAHLPKIEAFQKRMGWHFPWVSSYNSDFNFDYRVSFTREEMESGKNYYNFGTSEFPRDEAAGVSVFFKNADSEIFHTYSSYGRGPEFLLGAYSYLDLVPKGRDEEGLPWTMAWVRHHDRYDLRSKSADSCCNSAETHK